MSLQKPKRFERCKIKGRLWEEKVPNTKPEAKLLNKALANDFFFLTSYAEILVEQHIEIRQAQILG